MTPSLNTITHLINHPILITTLFPLLIIVAISGVSVLEDAQNCDGNCIQEMERLIEATPSSTGLSVNPFVYSAGQNFMHKFFSRVCDAYRGVDECMVRCESRSKQVSELKAAYSGLQFVCKEQREEFFSSLPCLSENESKGAQRCSLQINQSHMTTVLFTNSIVSREFHSMQLRFSSLCRDLSSVVRCMVPIIKDNCGEKPANLLLKFIGLEFSSFELLYRQLGFDAPLPASCRALIKFALANDRAEQQKARLFTKLRTNSLNFVDNDHQKSKSENCVFILQPSQLGLGIALVSRRFDGRVDEHLTTRKWKLDYMEICCKIGENGAKEMAVKTFWPLKMLPIPQKQLPNNIIVFHRILINYIDHNVVAFLRHFLPIFASYGTNLDIQTESDRVLAFVVRNIWPMLRSEIRAIEFIHHNNLHHFRQSSSSILRDCQTLHSVSSYEQFPAFPPEDSATATDCQALAKWLLCSPPRPDGSPRMFHCELEFSEQELTSKIDAFKADFLDASSPANFIINIWFHSSTHTSILSFDLTNDMTGERMVLTKTVRNYGTVTDVTKFVMVRSPMCRDENKWAKWEKEAEEWEHRMGQRNRNIIDIYVDGEKLDVGLLNTITSPNDQQQK
ncbi:hypothetical protein niasHT_011598 [Heterodera trifolii]|uniref:Uncharacterized protein n=1 Tax=Heterodera trifolii TaxID=157864 RepID=A0ABD2LF53_9BILA